MRIPWIDEHRPRYGYKKIWPTRASCPLCSKRPINHCGVPLYIPSIDNNHPEGARVVLYICRTCYNRYKDSNCIDVDELTAMYDADESYRHQNPLKRSRGFGLAYALKHKPYHGYDKVLPTSTLCPICKIADLRNGISPLYIPAKRFGYQDTTVGLCKCYYVCPSCYPRYYKNARSLNQVLEEHKCRSVRNHR